MDQGKITKELTVGWEALLNEFPVLSGMLHEFDQQDASGRRGRLKVVYPKYKGTDVLAFRDLTHRPDLDYHLLRKHHFPMDRMRHEEMLSRLAEKAGKLDVQKAVLVIQVNFVPNGLIIARALHHSLTDGFGSVAIMRLWASLCKGESIDPSIKPDFSNRVAMLPKQPPGDMTEFEEFVLHSDPKQMEIAKPTNAVQRKPTQTGPEKQEPNIVPPREAIPELFLFRQTKLDELKKAAVTYISQQADQKIATYISTNDILSAFLFVCMNRARLATEGAPTTSTFPLSIVVSARNRESPPLPATFVGNTVLFVYLDLSQEEATDLSMQNLSAIAQRLRSKVLQHDEAYIERLISTLDQVEDISKVAPRAMGHPYQFLVTSLANAGLNYNDIEWGPGIGAKCEKVRVPKRQFLPASIAQGFVIVLGAKQNQLDPAQDGLEVFVMLEKPAMARLKAMKEWNDWCEWRCD